MALSDSSTSGTAPGVENLHRRRQQDQPDEPGERARQDQRDLVDRSSTRAPGLGLVGLVTHSSSLLRPLDPTAASYSAIASAKYCSQAGASSTTNAPDW